MFQAELWKPLPGFTGYEVSDRGHVRSLRTPVRLQPEGRGRERRYIMLWNDAGQRKHMAVHRMVLLAFQGPPPDGTEACHNDGNPANNRLENLRWDTHLENMRDKRQHGTNLSGARHPRAKASWKEVRRMKAMLADGFTGAQIARCLGVSENMVSRVKRGENWKEGVESRV